MIKTWLLTGDTHGQNETRLGNIFRTHKPENPEETAVIILGDAGYNFFLNKTDNKHKKDTCHMWVYCVRGNHEARPEDLEFPVEYDENVCGEVYVDPINNKIRYFLDGGEYNIGGHSVLVIGGAYSVDKWWRLQRAGFTDRNSTDYPSPKACGWFPNEQLTPDEMVAITAKIRDKHYDLVLTHTCPIGWEPTDLFLNHVDQSSVDKSMEIWLDDIKSIFSWKIWCFGHYHADRCERFGVEQFFYRVETLDAIWNRWEDNKTFEEENQNGLPKSPMFYAEV